MTEAFRIVQSFVADVNVERHIGEFVVKSGLSDLAIEQLRSAGYWSLCGWFHTVLLRPGTPASQALEYAVLMAAMIRLSERGIGQGVVFLDRSFEERHKDIIERVDGMVIDYSTDWVGNGPVVKSVYPYTAILIQNRRRIDAVEQHVDEILKP